MNRSRLPSRTGPSAPAVAAVISLLLGLSAYGQELPRFRQLQVIQPNGKGLKALPCKADQTYGSPDWSPDGKWIAYDTWSAGEDYTDARIEIMRADGSEVREIGAGAMPSWSPDGKQIVAHTYDSPQTCVVMNLDGSGREVVVPHWGSPRWSPVGNRIVTAYPGSGLAVFELATGKEYRILPQHAPHQGLSISPDGTQICFASRSSTQGGNAGGALMLVTLDEKTMQASARALVKPGFFSHSSFSPDGRRIAFTWQPKEGQDIDQIYLVDIAGAQPPQKLKGQNESVENSDPDWSPDGKLIVFTGHLPAGQVGGD
jgi:Tol biopolymer transport system component